MVIRKSIESNLSEIERVHLLAFGKKEGKVIVKLVNELFKDESAKPSLSLVAVENKKIVGHILFTNIIIPQANRTVSAQILAPLAVLPAFQGKGIGSQLVKEGLSFLKKSKVDLVFVLGHPKYYSRFAFLPAGVRGFEAPYPIPGKNVDAWMVLELHSGLLGRIKGKIKCADMLNKPEYWRE